MHLRPLSHPADAPAVAALLAAAAAADGHPPLSEEKHNDFVEGAERGRGVVGEMAGEVVGYAHLLPTGDATWQVELAMSPQARSPGAYRQLAEGALRTLPADDVARIWSFADDQVKALEEMGLQAERQLLQMQRPLPAPAPQLPDGMALRSFRPGIDDETWLRTHNAAFATDGGGPGWTPADLAGRLDRDWFDAAGFLLAWEGADLAGYCWTKVHPGRIGEIYVIGIHPAQRGRGMGAALVLAGLEDLSVRRQCTTAMLYVDGNNDPAVRLYRWLGFTTARVDRSFSTSGLAQPNR